MNSTTFGGDWTIDKLEILRRYLDAYTTALKEQPSKERPFNLIYVDAFAGAGDWRPGKGYYREYVDFRELRQGSPHFVAGWGNLIGPSYSLIHSLPKLLGGQ